MKLRNKLHIIFSIIAILCGNIAVAQNEITDVSVVTTDIFQFEKIEFAIGVDADFNNPYDAAEIKLDLIVETPAQQALTVPCFYESGSEWRARFSPRESGIYHYHFVLEKDGAVVDTSDAGTFTAEPSASDGFITKGTNWVFNFDSGKPFRGIGENIGWEGRNWENDIYTYEYFLSQLKANGGNLFRTWMGAWNLPLEWKTVVDTKRYQNSTEHFHRGGIARMDELVELCDSLGLYIMLALDWHGGLQTGDRWNIHPYNSANGGPANSPSEFFTKAESKARYKNRLRYLVARWGYSPSIAAWEFFNEIDNAVYNGTESTVAIPHQAVTDWHREMATYLHDNDPYNHLVTTSISHREITGLFNLTELDFVQRHLYRVTGSIPNTIQNSTNSFGKPFVVGEFGYDWDWNNINAANGANLDYDYKRGLWYGLFSNTPILPLSWWWEFFDQRNTDAYFRGVREISDRMLQAGDGEFAKVTVTPSGDGLESLAVKCGNRYFVYLLNNRTDNVSDRSIALSVPNGTYALALYDPEVLTDSIMTNLTVDAGELQLSNINLKARESLIVMISDVADVSDVQTPWTTAATIPGKVEAENFDKGGEGIAYHDLDNTNLGGFRPEEGVDVGSNGDVLFVTDIVNGEWLEFAVNIQTPGRYVVQVRCGSGTGNGQISFELNGSHTMMEVPHIDNGFDTLEFSTDILEAGLKTLRLSFEGLAFDLDYMNFQLVNRAPQITLITPAGGETFESGAGVTMTTEASDEDGTIAKVDFFVDDQKVGEDQTAPFSYEWTAASGSHRLHAVATDDLGLSVVSTSTDIVVNKSLIQTPFPDPNIPHPVPGKIEAENFDEGEEGIAFHDLSIGNVKGQYRTEVDPDIETCTDAGGGYNLADIQNGEWVEYQVNVEAAGTYDFTFRVATTMDAQKFLVAIDGQTVASNVSVPNTGGWQTWQDVSVNNIDITEGLHVLKFLFGSEYFNLNYFTISQAGPVGAEDNVEKSLSVFPNPVKGSFTVQVLQPAKELSIIDTQGRLIFKETDTVQFNTHLQKPTSAGFYLIKVFYESGKSEYLRVVVLP